MLGAACAVGGVALSALATSNAVRACGFSPWCSERAPAVFIAVFTLAWGSVIAVFDMREILVALCAALCVQWVPFVAVGFMGAVAKGALAGVLAAAVVVVLARVR